MCPGQNSSVDRGITAQPLRGEEGGDRDDEWDPLVSGGASESGRRAGASGVQAAGVGRAREGRSEREWWHAGGAAQERGSAGAGRAGPRAGEGRGVGTGKKVWAGFSWAGLWVLEG